MKKWHLKLISRLLIATVCISLTTYSENIEEVLFGVLWLNVPHSLKISGSFGNDSTIQRLTEWNIPRRMPHKKK